MEESLIATPQDNTDKRRLPMHVLLFIGLTVTSGVFGQLLVQSTQRTFDNVPWGVLVPLLLLIVLAEHLAIQIDDNSHTSVSAVILLAIGFLFGMTGSLLAAAVFAISGMFHSHSAIYKVIFNFGNVLTASAGATLTLHLVISGLDLNTTFSSLLLPAAAAGLVFYAINHSLLCFVRGIAEERNPLDIWRREFEWLSLHYAALGIVGVLLASVTVSYGWTGIAGLTTPIAMMQYAMRQYISRTTALVTELQQTNEQLTESHDAILRALSSALDTRDEETEEHSQRVCRYAELIARHHGLTEEEIADLRDGSLLHDIGKIGVPDAVLLKPGPLTEDEWVQVRKHPEIGHRMIAHIPFLAPAAEVVLYHHERYDGNGYPFGLAAGAIPLNARIFAIADSLDAMTSDRPYRQGLPYADAMAEIARCAGSQFDPEIVRSALSINIAALQAVPSAAVLDTRYRTTTRVVTADDAANAPAVPSMVLTPHAAGN